MTKAHVGLPFTATARLMPFSGGAEDGSSKGRLKDIHHLTFDLYKSVGLKYGKDTDSLKEVFFTDVPLALDDPTLFTGLKQVSYESPVDPQQQPVIVSDSPTPCNIFINNS